MPRDHQEELGTTNQLMEERMKERPILFSVPMIRALLDKDHPKTQTRRVIKPQPDLAESFSQQYPPYGPRTSYGYSCWYPSAINKRAKHYGNLSHFLKGMPIDFCPYGVSGDRLWVKEAWQALRNADWISMMNTGREEQGKGKKNLEHTISIDHQPEAFA